MSSHTQNKFDKILKYDLCIGCGLCETLDYDGNYKMVLNDSGFYKPTCIGNRSEPFEIEISRICPGLNINVPKFNNPTWGNINKLYSAWSGNQEIRRTGSSGGAISALCIYLIENRIVDGILQVGKIDGHTIENKLLISKKRGEILKNASSRYAPARVFNEFISILDSSNETYCFVGKPCDIGALKNFLTGNPRYQNRINYYLSFFCAGMPSYKGTTKLLARAKQKELPNFLKYRGDGWPGYFIANFSNGEIYKTSYEDSWGEVLGKCVHSRCKICPDGIGLLADIVFGDAWETKDGYPDFEERDGKSLIIARTASGEELLKAAFNQKILIGKELKPERVEKMQPYQYQRRLFVGYRIIIIQALTNFLLNFKSTGYLKLMSKYPMHKGIQNSLGTFKRFILKKKEISENG